MAQPSYPKTIPSPFAENGDKANIPENNAGDGRLDYANGFPIETQLPVQAGGVPPQRLDFNGALNELSQHTYYQQSGGQYNWSSALDYPKNSLVVGSDDSIYKCLIANGATTGGARNPIYNPTYWQEFGGAVGVPDASYTTKGILQFATLSETKLGLLETKGINPKNLMEIINDLPVGSGANVDLSNITSAGLNVIINAVPQASYTVRGKIEIATLSETRAGTSEDKAVNPKNLMDIINQLGVVDYTAPVTFIIS